MVRKELTEGFGEIGMAVAMKIAGDFLQGDDIRIPDAVGDPHGVEFVIQTHTELDVVADELHDTL